MSQTVDIGAARINLVVDASDYEPVLNRLKNTAADFGNAAEQAFERSSGKARTAANRLLDYVATLGRAESQLERMVRQASRAGVEAPVIAAAVREYQHYASAIEVAKTKTEAWEQAQKKAAVAARGLADEIRSSSDNAAKAANERARAYVEGRAAQQSNNGQSQINALLGVSERDATAQARRRADAEAAILPFLQQQEREYEQMLSLANQINNARDEQSQLAAQGGINRQLGVVERDVAAQAQRRADAEAAILPLLQRQERELEQQLQLAYQINNARDEAMALNSQRQFNAALGVQDSQRSPGYIAEQRRVVELFNQQAIAEQAVEAEARDIHAQWVAIERQITSVGKSTYDIMRANVQQKYGASGAPLIDQINKWEKLNTTISGTTVNTKQLQQAIRFLPAQFTDIGVSLAGGMNPLMVALQQGGQILDQFRLSGMDTAGTFRAIGKYALSLVNPVTVGATALGLLAYAGYDAAKSMEELAVATAKGFNVAGGAEELYALTESLNRLENVRLGPAEQAVARLAANGRLAGENFELAAEATARWSSLTGEAADRVASQFEAIAKDPLQAIESGLVRVTQAQYDQVRALVAVGDQQGAVNALVKIFYETVNSNSAQVEAHLSGVSRYVQSIKDGFGEATRAAGGYFNSVLGWMADYEATYQRMVADGSNPFVAQIRAFNVDPKLPAKPEAAATPLADPAAQARERARVLELNQFLATADEAAQRRITVNRMREEGKRLQLTEAQTNDVIKRQEAAWAKADAKRTKTGAGRGTGARTAARDVRYDYQLESALLQTQTREVQAAYAIKKISAESYYKSLQSLAQQEFDIQKRSNAEQLAAIGGKKGQEHEVARLRVADAIAEQQLAQRTIDIQSQQAQYLRQLDQERRNYTNGLRDSVQAQQEEFDTALARLTMGNREFERWDATNELRREEARLLREISRQQEDGAITSEEAERRKQEAIQATIDKLAQTAGMYDRIDAAQADWAVGASKAWKNWQDDVADVASQSEAFMTQALEGFADATTDALTGNMDSWADYFDGLARMITQFIVKQKLTDWIKSLSAGQAGGGGAGGGLWGFLGNLAGALFGGGGGGSAPVPGSGGPTVGPMFQQGGYTGDGRDNEIAGFVHKNEYVVPAPVVRAIRSGRADSSSQAPQVSKTVIINQSNKFDMASDKTTRDQYRREQAGVTQKAMAKV